MNAKPVRVLIVEDDEDDVVLARQHLADIEHSAFQIDWAADYESGMSRLLEGAYDVCLLDYHLGARDGVEFIREAMSRGCAVPLILLTGEGDHSVDMAAMNAGAADFLNKTELNPAILGRSIRYAIEHRRAEQQRIRLIREQAARVEAEAANKAKDRFLAVLSHELRTPLTAVLLTLSALEQESEASSKTRELVEIIRRNADLEARLIDDLLDLTRIARGKLEIRRELIDLHEQIGHAVRDCCGVDIHSKNLKLTVRTDAKQHHVWGDPARLQQVLWNLIKNAAKFTPPGGKIDVRSFNHEGLVRVCVTDTGIGIAPDALPKIFAAFEQADRSITRQFGGLGLGLAICRALVELHGGRVWAESDGPNHGATFTLELPVVAADLTLRGAGDVSETAGAGKSAGVSILLVEDHADTASAMARLLCRRGYSVHTANRVSDALKAAEERKFDVLISDIGLPDGTGLDLMRHLRQRGDLKGIALSGFGMEEDLERSRSAGFIEHLTKPIDFKHLEGVIARVVGRGMEPSVAPTSAPR